MYKATTRTAAIVAGAAICLLFDASAALAQVVQSEIGGEPGSSETTQLVTSSTEVRRAVLGLLVIAGVVGLLTIVYWYKTGQQARQRFARRYGGRHLAGQGHHDLVDDRGPWGTDAAYLDQVEPQPHSAYGQPVYAAPGRTGQFVAPEPYPDHQVRGPYPDQMVPAARARPTWTGQTDALAWPPPAEQRPHATTVPQHAQPAQQGPPPAHAAQPSPPGQPEQRPRPQFFE